MYKTIFGKGIIALFALFHCGVLLSATDTMHDTTTTPASAEETQTSTVQELPQNETASATVEITSSSGFEHALTGLTERSFKKKEKAVAVLSEYKEDDRVLPLLKALLNGELYYRKQDKKIVITKKSSDLYNITDVITQKSLGKVEKNQLSKIIANNKIRRQLRAIIARISLSNAKASVRLTAAREMLSKPDDDSIALFKEALPSEQNSGVAEVLKTGIALSEVDSDDKRVRINAIYSLSGSLYPEVRNKLNKLMEKDEAGNFLEQDEEIRTVAKASLKSIKTNTDFYAFIETIFFGISLGSVLLLAAIGLAITFGVMGVINMAHGELIMIGAYTTYVIQMMMPDSIALSLFVAIPAAFIVSGLFGIAIERGVIRYLYGRPLETLLATFGISLILQQLVRSIFTALNKSVETPAWMSGALEINAALSITYNRLYIIIFSIMVFFALLAILKKTSLGLQVRAVSQNRSMAKAMGVKTEWVDALTFGLGSGIAGVAGVALSQLTNVGPNLGQAYIIDSFMVVVFGGVGNLWGTLVGAMSLGVVNKFLEPWSGAVLAKIFVLVFIILFIQKRPRGLFPQQGRAAED